MKFAQKIHSRANSRENKLHFLIMVIFSLFLLCSVSYCFAKYAQTTKPVNLLLDIKSRFDILFEANQGIITYPTSEDVQQEGSVWKTGSQESASKTLELNDLYGELPEAKRTGYDFVGWSIMKSESEGIYALPEGYGQLDYIKSTGSQYINLPYGFDKTDIIKLTCAVDDLSQDKFITTSSTWNNNNNRFAMGGGYGSSFGVGFGGSKDTTQTQFPSQYTRDKNKHTWTYENLIFKITDLGCSYDTTGISWGGETTPLILFYGYASNTKGSIYYFEQYKNEKLALQLIPAIWNGGETTYSSNNTKITGNLNKDTVGLYDTVNDVFYINSGNGSFEYGKKQYSLIGSNSVFATPNDQTIYATWKPLEIKLNLFLNDENGSTRAKGDLGSGIKLVTYDSEIGNLPAISRKGYNAIGWIDEDGIIYQEDSVVDFTEDKNLYANWEAQEFTVSFNPTGGQVNTENKLVSFDSLYGDLPTPTKPGYVFKQWVQSPDLFGIKIVNSLTSDGSKYIELPYGFDQNDEIELVCSMNVIANDKFIVSTKTWSPNNNRFTMGGSFTNFFSFGYGSSTTAATILSPNTVADKNIHTWTYKDHKFNMTDLNLSYDVSGIAYGTESPAIRLFFGYNSNTSGTIYSFKQIRDGETLLDLLPAVWMGSDDVTYSKNGVLTTGPLDKETAGMYDKVHEIFYIGSSGNFTYEGEIPEDPERVVTSDSYVTVYKDHTLYAEWDNE